MAVSLAPDVGFGLSSGVLAKRQQCEMLRGQLELQRASFIPVWKDCNDYILPQRARFQVTDTNRGDRRNLKIIDSTGTLAARVCAAGLVANVTSPANPWFELATPDPALNEDPEVKAWLRNVSDVLRDILQRSNFYTEIPTLYGDIATFGTGAMICMDDEEDVVRFYDFPVGSYAIGNDQRRQVRIFSRVFRLTVQQVVERWGQINPSTGKPNFEDGRPTTISLSTQNLWKSRSRQLYVDLVNIIQPNQSYDGRKIDSKYKRFESVTYEMGSNQNPFTAGDSGVLAHEGYDDFPVLVSRWETSGEDVYGTNWPGLMALGDIKQLQTMTKRGGQALEKWINPAMTGPAALMGAAASLLPGNITYSDVTQGQLGFRPVHELAQVGAAIQAMREDKSEVRERINDAYLVPIFLMLSSLDDRERTATEIMERKEEKLLITGPVLEQVTQDVLSPTIARTYNCALKRNMIPPPPDALHGQTLVPVYVSIMAQAQKQTGLSGLDRVAAFTEQMFAVDPTIVDGLDSDEMLREYAEGAGIPPKVVRKAEDTQAIRDARQKQQQQAMAAENAPKVAGAVKSLGDTPMNTPSALTQLMGTSGGTATALPA